MWATASTSSYAGTCIFLVVLGVILLFLVSSRSMQEERSSRRELNRRHVLFLNKDSSGGRNELESVLTPNGLEKDIITIEQHARAQRPWATIILKATMTTLTLTILYIQYVPSPTMRPCLFLTALQDDIYHDRGYWLHLVYPWWRISWNIGDGEIRPESDRRKSTSYLTL